MVRSILALTVLLASSVAVAAEGDSILGVWLTQTGKAKVQISHCEHDMSRYCGEVVWLKEPLFTAKDGEELAGKEKVDLKNPDKSLRQRPVMGMAMLSNFRFAGDNKWEKGKIYDPTKGKTYKSHLKLKDANTLKVRGYIGISLIGRTADWTRVK